MITYIDNLYLYRGNNLFVDKVYRVIGEIPTRFMLISQKGYHLVILNFCDNDDFVSISFLINHFLSTK